VSGIERRQPTWRARRRGARRVAADAHEQTNGLIREAMSFLVDYGNRLPVWLKGAKLSREDKDALVRTLHQVANELTLLARKVDGHRIVGGAHPRVGA
jgi:hypothetical protein